MNTYPVVRKVRIPFKRQASWRHGSVQCRLVVEEVLVTVKMKDGAERPGEPGWGWEFEKTAATPDAADEFVNSLPDSFGPQDCEALGFTKTSEVIYD